MWVGLLLVLPLCLAFTEIDQTKYEEGRRQIQVLERNSQMPSYGRCWKGAISQIQVGCRHLTDVVQSRLALAYLNCFLGVQGRETYQCEAEEPIASCTRYLTDVDRNSFTTFFTHTHNICYFLQAQVWHEETEETIENLASQSKQVVSELRTSSQLQHELNRKQSETLQNQEEILEKAANLSDIITESSDNIHEIFDEFKTSTSEQRQLINEIFDRVSKLHSTIVDEFSGFYTLIYYTLAIIICYILTSTPRTSGARFWLFGLMTISLIVETFLLRSLHDGIVSMKMNVRWLLRESNFHSVISPYIPSHLLDVPGENAEAVELYVTRWLCRKVAVAAGLLLLAVSAWRYRDLAVVNNQLLLEIRKQNSEIKHFLQGKMSKSEDQSPPSPRPQESLPVEVETSQADSTGYESELILSETDTEVSGETGSYSTYTDRTYKPSGDTESTKSGTSFSTALTNTSKSSRKSKASSRTRSLQRELKALQSSTFKGLTQPLVNWARTGYYKHPSEDGDDSDVSAEFSDTEGRITRSRSGSPSPRVIRADTPQQHQNVVPSSSQNPITVPGLSHTPGNLQGQCPPVQGTSAGRPPVTRPYGLRARYSSSPKENIVLRAESPRGFTKTVKRLERLAIKNSQLVKRSILREERLPPSSDDDK